MTSDLRIKISLHMALGIGGHNQGYIPIESIYLEQNLHFTGTLVPNVNYRICLVLLNRVLLTLLIYLHVFF